MQATATATLKPRHREQIGSFTFRITEDNRALVERVRAICRRNNWTVASAITVALGDWADKHGTARDHLGCATDGA